LSAAKASQHVVVGLLGFTQILGYGSSYYLLAILSLPISSDTAWPLPWVIAGLSIGMLSGGFASPFIGCVIDRRGGRPVLVLGSLLLALGLAGVGSAVNLGIYLIGWCTIGLGMAASATTFQQWSSDSQRGYPVLA
jgi:MFS family permease